MQAPTVNHYGDTWEYLWPDSGFAIGFAHLRESRGELHGELWVGSERPAPNRNGHIVWGSFNLSSPGTRAKMAVSCKERAKIGTVDQWISMFEYACLTTAEQFRKGEPLRDLSEVEPVLKVDYLIHPLLASGETASLFADGDSGKGWIALGLGLSLVLGGEVVPGLTPARQSKVLYLDWETSYEENVRRQGMLCRGVGIESHIRPTGILYRHMTRALADDLAVIKAAVDREGIGLVIIDSAGPATGAELKESDPVVRFMSALRSLNATKLVLGHVNKATADSSSSSRGRMFGSIFFENLSRSCWEVRSDTEYNPIEIGFFHRKANMGRKHKPFAVGLAFDDEACSARFSRADIFESPVVAGHAPLSDRMVAALRRGSMDTKQLADRFDVSEATVRTTLNRASNQGVVVQLAANGGKGGRGSPGVWGLAAKIEEGR